MSGVPDCLEANTNTKISNSNKEDKQMLKSNSLKNVWKKVIDTALPY